jgi:DNA repair protein RadC
MSESSKHEGHRARLRERFLSGDAASRSDAALLELLLTYAIPQRDVQPLAKSLVARFGGLEGVLGATAVDLCKIDGLKQNSVVLLKVADELLRRKSKNKYPALPDVGTGKALEGQPPSKQEEMAEILNVAQQTGTITEKPIFRRPVARYGTELFGKAVLKEAIEMLPRLPDSEDLDKAREFLRQNLHFSAEGTRSRYAAYITRRMFPNGVADKALRQFAKAFPGKTELRDVCFYRFCKAEPLMLKIAQDMLIPALGLGRISRQKLKGYLTSRFPQSGGVDDCTKAVVDALDAAGIAQSTRTDLQFHPRPIQPASFTFVLHSEFPEPGIYGIEKAEANPSFSCLLWDPGQITNALYECRNRGWISKVSQIDNVRQFTLRYRLDEVVAMLAKGAEQR